jgi:hypothetical protein
MDRKFRGPERLKIGYRGGGGVSVSAPTKEYPVVCIPIMSFSRGGISERNARLVALHYANWLSSFSTAETDTEDSDDD